MSNHNLFTLSADGAVVPASSETILIAARQVLAHRVRRDASLQSPQKARKMISQGYANELQRSVQTSTFRMYGSYTGSRSPSRPVGEVIGI
jgi:hypothetical protein